MMFQRTKNTFASTFASTKQNNTTIPVYVFLLFFLSSSSSTNYVTAAAAAARSDGPTSFSETNLHSSLTTTATNKKNKNRKLPFLDDFGWGQFDTNFDFENWDWNNFDLIDNDFSWGDLFDFDINGDGNPDICPIIEGLIGIGQAFGIAGDCTCDGSLSGNGNDDDNRFSIGCHFDDECIDPWVCGSVGFNVALGDTAGAISTSVCVDLIGSIPEICYNYTLNVADSSSTGERFTQSCSATYDGNECICEISDSCFRIDCSPYLPGAAMDTCQLVDRFNTEADAAKLLPRFQIFQPDFEFTFDEIDWPEMNWPHFDWENFDVNNFWNSQSDWSNTGWSDIFGPFDGEQQQTWDTPVLCPVIERLAGVGEHFGIAGGCECVGTVTEGLGIQCNFDEECIDPAICGSVDFDMSLGERPGAFSTNICVDNLMDGTYPEICYRYDLNIVDGSMVTQTCEATYDGNSCACDIEDFCLRIDCSQYLPGAVMDTCQYIGGGAGYATESDAANLVPRFRVFQPDFEFTFDEIDWPELNWPYFDWENFDVNNFWNSQSDWSNTGWSDIFGPFDGEQQQPWDTPVLCPVIERLAGVGEHFGIAGGCECVGTVTEGLGIQCNFDEECIDPAICGSVDFDMSLGERPGAFSTNICVDNLMDGTYPEICYRYDLNIVDGSMVTQTCEATYDGNSCACDIEDFCLRIDCSQYLPGAVMDTCQYIGGGSGYATVTDAADMVPRLRSFEPNFEFTFDEISWPDMDWTNFDWNNFNIEDFWNSQSDWADTNWGDIFGDTFETPSFCSALERLAGIGEAFGIAGGCDCQGTFEEGLSIGCNFEEECVDPDTCGSVNFDLSLGEQPGVFSTRVCVDNLVDGAYPQICYRYDLALTEDWMVSQSCEASYDGMACGCEISEDSCLRVDCSQYLPGASMDTCQYVDNFLSATDAANLIPNFPVFQRDYEFSFGDIDWTQIDWANLDWENFDASNLWDHADRENTKWSDIFAINVDPAVICPVLEEFAGIGEAFGIAGGCTCSGDSVTGFTLTCSFENVCADDGVADGDAIAVSRIAVTDVLCVSTASISYSFDNLSSVNGEVCVEYSTDEHPKTCFSYLIPLPNNNDGGNNGSGSDSSPSPECGVTYGDEICGCTIDENLCVSIDCSAYNENAVASTCHDLLSLKTEEDVTTLIPMFATAPPANDGQKEVGNNGADGLNGGESSSASFGLSFAAVATTTATTCLSMILWFL